MHSIPSTSPFDTAADHFVSDVDVDRKEDQIRLLVLPWLAFLHWQRDETGSSGSTL